MKNLRQLCVAVVLTLVVAAHTFAGDMHTLVADPPPPSADGDIHTLVADAPPPTAATDGQMDTMSSEAIDPVTETVLSLLQSVLTLF